MRCQAKTSTGERCKRPAIVVCAQHRSSPALDWHKPRSKRCAADRHAWHDAACTRAGCNATRTHDLFGKPLDASAGPLFPETNETKERES